MKTCPHPEYLTAGTLVNPATGEYCVVGWLAHCNGTKDLELNMYEAGGILRVLFRQLEQAYELSEYDIKYLIELNDSTPREHRIKRVEAFLNKHGISFT